jgi:hypothetical protein
MFDALGLRRENDGLTGTDDRGRRLKKDERFFGHFIAEFCGMRSVIAPDAHNLAWIDGSE